MTFSLCMNWYNYLLKYYLHITKNRNHRNRVSHTFYSMTEMFYEPMVAVDDYKCLLAGLK